MISLVGYNFCSDINAADPTPTNIDLITSTTIQNGIYDHLNISSNAAFDYTTIQPTDWDFDTILNSSFNGNISGGNVEEFGANITMVKIKRRVHGTFDWTTIYEIPINQVEQLSFIVHDFLNLNNIQYEYAFVPVTNGVEGSYIIDSVMSQYNGVFVCDMTNIFSFLAGVSYGDGQQVQQIGVFQPYNRTYPVIVANGSINYRTGSITGKVIPSSFYNNNQSLNRFDISQLSKSLISFLTNKKPKIIKDWNGNAWLCFITDNLNIVYDNSWGMGIMDITASWTEIGDINSKNDLYEAGLIPTED